MLNINQKLQQKLNIEVYPELSDRLTFGCEILYRNDVFKINENAIFQNGIMTVTHFDIGIDIRSNEYETLGFPISLDLIMAALWNKGYRITFDDSGVFCNKGYEPIIQFDYTPFQPLSQDSIKTLCQIFEVEL